MKEPEFEVECFHTPDCMGFGIRVPDAFECCTAMEGMSYRTRDMCIGCRR